MLQVRIPKQTSAIRLDLMSGIIYEAGESSPWIMPYPLLGDPVFDEIDVSVPGFLEQGADYAFDGHGVFHAKLEGYIYPPGWEVKHGFLCRRVGSSSIRFYEIWIPQGVYFEQDNIQDGQERIVFSHWTRKIDQLTFHTYFRYERSGDNTLIRGKLRTVAEEIESQSGLYERHMQAYWRYSIRLPDDWKSMSRHDVLAFIAGQAYVQFQSAEFYSQSVYNFRVTDLPSKPIDFDTERYQIAMKHRVKLLGRRFLGSSVLRDLRAQAWAEMAHECVDGQRALNANGLNWVSKLGSWGGEIKAFLSLIADPSDPKQWASMWLSTRFGSRLEWKTSMDVLDAVWDRLLTIRTATKYDGYVVSRSRKRYDLPNGTISYTSRLVCSNASITGLMTSIKKFMEWGAWPSLNNAFDLIPFSFVLDWFTNLSTILDNVDDLVYKQYLDVQLWETSVSYSTQLSTLPKASACVEDVRLNIYERTGTRQLPEFGILSGWEPSLPSLVNCVDGASLLVQIFG